MPHGALNNKRANNPPRDPLSHNQQISKAPHTYTEQHSGWDFVAN